MRYTESAANRGGTSARMRRCGWRWIQSSTRLLFNVLAPDASPATFDLWAFVFGVRLVYGTSAIADPMWVGWLLPEIMDRMARACFARAAFREGTQTHGKCDRRRQPMG